MERVFFPVASLFTPAALNEAIRAERQSPTRLRGGCVAKRKRKDTSADRSKRSAGISCGTRPPPARRRPSSEARGTHVWIRGHSWPERSKTVNPLCTLHREILEEITGANELPKATRDLGNRVTELGREPLAAHRNATASKELKASALRTSLLHGVHVPKLGLH